MAVEKKLRKVPRGQVTSFKIKNRKGYAVFCKNNLTEGISIREAMDRMNKALKRMGYTV